jgi:hypothetical protein
MLNVHRKAAAKRKAGSVYQDEADSAREREALE